MNQPVKLGPDNRELEELARRLMWWVSPAEAFQNPRRLLAQVMAWGAWEDIAKARRIWGQDEFRQVLLAPIPGIFDKRSWSYWHRMLGLLPVPPLPTRQLS
jgi:hypothetical protein